MQKRKLLLSLVVLCSIVGMGITSCNNEPVQGPQGEQGPVGPQGPAGENGENGEDGSLILHGEGKPADSLGKDTDVYIDSKTGDLYQKDNGTWTLVMNIKGEDGQDGEDGSNGLSGSDGQDGETAWSNTILPSEGGYVVPSVGSAVEGSTVTFYIHPETGYSFESLTLNGTEYTTIEYDEDGVGQFTTTMVENGFVVQANFVNTEEIVNRSIYFVDGVIYQGGELDAAGNVIKEGTPGEQMFAGGDGSEEDPLLISNSEQFMQLKEDDGGIHSEIAVAGYYFNLTEDIDLTSIEGTDNTIMGFSGHIIGNKSNGSKPIIKVSSDNFDSFLFYDTYKDVTFENFVLKSSGVCLVAYNGWIPYNSGLENAGKVYGDKSKLVIKNVEINGSKIDTDLHNNWGPLIDQSCCPDITIDGVKVKFDYQGLASSYNGVIIGGYVTSDWYKDKYGENSKLTIKNCTFDGKFSSGYTGFLFGNGNEFNPSAIDYIFENNICNGTLEGYVTSSLLVGLASTGTNSYTLSDDEAKLGSTGSLVSYGDVLTYNEKTNTVSLKKADDISKVAKVEVSYSNYFKGYDLTTKEFMGTLLLEKTFDMTTDFNKEDGSIVISPKYFAYESNTSGDESLIKIDDESRRNSQISWELFINTPEDDQATTISGKAKTLVTFFDSEGGVIGAISI